MNSRQDILRVLRGEQIGRTPVSFYHFDPFDPNSFWMQHQSFKRLLKAAQESCDNFFFCRPRTGFFFSNPDSVQINEEKKQDTRISEIVTLRVETELGPITRVARTTKMSAHGWVEKPWVESVHDLERFLSLPYIPYEPELDEFFTKDQAYGDRAMPVISLPDPVGAAGALFAPGDLPKFLRHQEKLVEQTLEIFYERLVNVYRSVSSRVTRVIIRIRGSEYLTPPNVPPDYFRNYRDIFTNYVIRYDTRLINLLRQGNFNFICYHWHEIIEDLIPYVLRMGIDILEPAINTVATPTKVARIRKICGPNLTLMGGLSLEDLEFRSTDEIIRLVQDTIIQGGRNGRFILIPSGVPSSAPLSPQTEENFLAFIEAGLTSSSR
jgi:hypothetical protein